jgi:hypothetical protein
MTLKQLTLPLFAAALLSAACASAQTYIGFVYPAGGQQGSTFLCTLGGQSLDGVCGVIVTGTGVTGRVVEYNRRLNPQELQLLNEQLRELKDIPAPKRDTPATNMMARIEKIVDNYVQQPQCDSIANLVVAELTVARDAPPGIREIRLLTERGLSNPMAFHVGQLPEVTGEPLPTSPKQILGKEAQSLRKRKPPRAQDGKPADGMKMAAPPADGARSEIDDDEIAITLPCTVNGQIASGTADRYRFTARRGQRLVITTQARSLIPYLADAVPGWFQPVLALHDAKGREVAYNDDYRFKPDPVIFFEVPQDGDYTLAIHDAIFRGREDFVYRITLGELPFVTGIFPLGGQAGIPASVDIQGFNLSETHASPPTQGLAPGIHPFTVRGGRGAPPQRQPGAFLSPPVPFAVDALPDGIEKEPNDTPKNAQRIVPPVIVNGTVGVPGDRDLFLIEGRAGQEIVAEVTARTLDSPLDATLTLADAAGNRLAFNDDHDDPGAGVNTHPADAYIRTRLPADGAYILTLADAQRNGGAAYAYRLRVSPPQPDFELRVVPSRVVMASQGSASVDVHVLRKDGINVPVNIRLRDPASSGFTLSGQAVVSGTQTVTRVTLTTTLTATPGPVPLVIQGATTYAGQELIRDAVPAEDRMQAFFWRHLVPAQEFLVLVYPKK